MVGAHIIGPLLERGALHLERSAAEAADQMVMVLWGAATVASLAVGGVQHIDLTRGGHGLERPVHRRQSNI